MSPTSLAVAMHEAGHAVAQLADPPAPEIEYVTIVDLPPGMLGLVQVQSLWQPYMAVTDTTDEIRRRWQTLALRDVRFYLAGYVAEMRWKRYRWAGVLFGGRHMADLCFDSPEVEAHDDLGRSRARLLWAAPDDSRAAFLEAWDATEETVAKHWKAVQRIGRLLHVRGRIEGHELLEAWYGAAGN